MKNPALLSPAYQNEGIAYTHEIQCGTRRAGYYTAFMVYVGGTPNPHTGPLATREQADHLVARLNTPPLTAAEALGHARNRATDERREASRPLEDI